jgi:hypothetical protein
MRTDRQILRPAVRSAAVVSCVVVTLFTGCLGSGTPAPVRTATAPGGAHLEPSPVELGAVARIASVNPEHGFVVIDFASQTVPPVGTRLNVYRGDKRVGAVRITEPVRAPLATADIVEGQVRVGDEAH